MHQATDDSMNMIAVHNTVGADGMQQLVHVDKALNQVSKAWKYKSNEKSNKHVIYGTLHQLAFLFLLTLYAIDDITVLLAAGL